jgi:hypothetical protein
MQQQMHSAAGKDPEVGPAAALNSSSSRGCQGYTLVHRAVTGQQQQQVRLAQVLVQQPTLHLS